MTKPIRKEMVDECLEFGDSVEDALFYGGIGSAVASGIGSVVLAGNAIPAAAANAAVSTIPLEVLNAEAAAGIVNAAVGNASGLVNAFGLPSIAALGKGAPLVVVGIGGAYACKQYNNQNKQ